MRGAALVWFALAACDGAAEREASSIERTHPVVHTNDAAVDSDDAAVDSGAHDAAVDSDDAAVDSDAHDAAVDSDAHDAAVDCDTHDTAPDSDAAPDSDVTVDTIEPDAGPGDPCQIGALLGDCRHVADCDGWPVEGFCAGGPQIRCCLAADQAFERCSAERTPGACMNVADCPGPDWKTTAGLCPGAADIRCCTASTPAPVCDPELAPTPNDGLVEEPGDAGCPPGMAATATFCIDRFEASLVLDADPSVSWSPWHNPGATAVRAVSLRWGVPQGYIDEVRAAAACERSGKRLCTSSEWLAACQGDAGWTYPYGNVREPGRCNDDRKQHVAVEYFGTAENWIFSEIDNACLSQLPASLDLSGENEGCQTPDGVFDLMGNLHEWVDDPAGTFRGGFFDDTTINGNGCLYRTTAHDVSHWDYSTGFRCCADR